MEKTCKSCGEAFVTNKTQKIYCNRSCGENYTTRKRQKFQVLNDIAKGTKASITEYYVACDLMKKEYTLFRSMSISSFCDLVAIKDGQVYQIEARTGIRYEDGGVLNFPKKMRESTNCLAVYEQIREEIFYFDIHLEPTKLY